MLVMTNAEKRDTPSRVIERTRLTAGSRRPRTEFFEPRRVACLQSPASAETEARRGADTASLGKTMHRTPNITPPRLEESAEGAKRAPALALIVVFSATDATVQALGPEPGFAGLLAELERIQDPAKPVPVIAIGYGPDTDQDALEQIAAATDGAAYQALEPTDISTVLVDAVTQRGCRPYCG